MTGGAGFIGCNFVRHLLAADPSVRIVTLDALTYAGSRANLEGLGERHTFVEGDICDRPLVESLLCDHEVDTVVHFAAESHVDRSIAGPEVFVRTNVLGTFTLLECARQGWGERRDVRFHHISTDEVYGSLGPDDPPFTELSHYRPNSPYSASKAGADHLARSYFHTYGLPVTTSNCSNNYGPFQHTEKFIPTVIRSCLAGRPIPIYGDGSNRRDWLHVEDHCRGIECVLRRGVPGETYNLGGGCEVSNLEVVDRICHLMDELHPRPTPYRELRSFVTDRPGHDWRYAIDIGKVSRELGWRPTRDFTDGLRQTIAFYA